MKKIRIANPRASRLALALALSIASGSLLAQSTTGTISGTVSNAAGKTVVVESTSGFRREVPVDANGRYTIGNLSLDTYKVTVKQGDSVIGVRDNVGITVGKSTDVSFGGGDAQSLGTVTVTGARVSSIDVSSVDTRTVLTSQQLQQLPLARNAEAIALLAPGVVNNSGSFRNGPLGGSLPSFGGSAASENAYYLNGFNTTNTQNNLGGLTLPYGAIEQQEIFTGGYGAQYGRSNGGVINQVGKRGTNKWHFGAAAIWEPNALKTRQKDLYWRADSQNSTSTNGQYVFARAANGMYQPLSQTRASTSTYSAYASGPIVKDRLFFFVAAEQANSFGVRIRPNRDTNNGNNGGYTDYKYTQKRWYAKLDWQITDDHRLEFTSAADKYQTDGTVYKYNYVYLRRGAYFTREDTNKAGPSLLSGKYTGYFGDNFTVTAMYGKMKTPDQIQYFNYSAANGPLINNAPLENPAYTGGTPLQGAQKINLIASPDRRYEKENLRLNLEWRLGNHKISGGIDNQKLKGFDIGTQSSGPGYSWTYGRTSDPYGTNPGANGLITQATNEAGGVGVRSPGLVDPTYGASGYYVTKDTVNGLNSYDATQKAYYIEDAWQVTSKLLLNLGMRRDEFTNFVPISHQPYINVKAWSPRIGFSWDVNGDSSFKVYGNLGRYYLGLPLSAVGLFTASTDKNEYFTYKGINSDGTPIISTSLGPAASANSRFGRAADPRAAVVKDIKGENQDEVILGFSKKLGIGWVLGVRGTHRRLNDAIDDQNFDKSNRGLVNSAAAQGVAIDWTRTAGAELINPGRTNVWNVYDTAGNLRQVSVTNDAAGFPKLKRNYSAVEFNLERPFDGKWYAKLNYVWSHSSGTTEGQLRSDLFRTGSTIALGGYQGQASVSTTQSWDHAALMENMDGDQTNDHRHQFKLYGYYQWTREWGLSGNLSMISGTPKVCLGNYAGTSYTGNDPAGYTSSVTGSPYHYCNGKPSPPGSHGRTGWVNQLDVGVTYKPAFAKGLAVNLNVFNVTNAQTATNYYPFSEFFDGSRQPLYAQPVAYQAPRYARMTVSYDF